jgi:hypothetical protein
VKDGNFALEWAKSWPSFVGVDHTSRYLNRRIY